MGINKKNLKKNNTLVAIEKNERLYFAELNSKDEWVKLFYKIEVSSHHRNPETEYYIASDTFKYRANQCVIDDDLQRFLDLNRNFISIYFDDKKNLLDKDIKEYMDIESQYLVFRVGFLN